MKILLLIAAACLLTACQPDDPIVGSEVRVYELVSMKPPKRFNVTLRDVKTGEISEHYVVKRCANWEKNIIGNQYPLTVKIKRSGSFYLSRLKDTFC